MYDALDFQNWFWRLLLAVVLGGIVGFERQYHGRPAGLRTHILVCLGTALVTLAGVLLAGAAQDSAGLVSMDATRIAAGVITGIGFLGAGAIIRTGDIVRGLTTAASIWFTAGLGIVIGFGFFTVAGVATAIELLVLIGLVYAEDRIPPFYYRDLIVQGEGIPLDRFEQACRRTLSDHHIKIREVETELVPAPLSVKLVFRLQLHGAGLRNEAINRLSILDGVRHVAWKRLQQVP
ncbi:MAG: MgtC/SapB family protein [Kiritimatiellia bacterium]|jgi:putative Mg2+ transporter-C (MgtC) family protein